MRREEIEYCKARAGKASATLEDNHGMRKRRICAISAISANDGRAVLRTASRHRVGSLHSVIVKCTGLNLSIGCMNESECIEFSE